MRLVHKATGEQVNASAAGAKVLLARGTHEEIPQPKTKPAAKKAAAATEPKE